MTKAEDRLREQAIRRLRSIHLARKILWGKVQEFNDSLVLDSEWKFWLSVSGLSTLSNTRFPLEILLKEGQVRQNQEDDEQEFLLSEVIRSTTLRTQEDILAYAGFRLANPGRCADDVPKADRAPECGDVTELPFWGFFEYLAERKSDDTSSEVSKTSVQAAKLLFGTRTERDRNAARAFVGSVSALLPANLSVSIKDLAVYFTPQQNSNNNDKRLGVYWEWVGLIDRTDAAVVSQSERLTLVDLLRHDQSYTHVRMRLRVSHDMLEQELRAKAAARSRSNATKQQQPSKKSRKQPLRFASTGPTTIIGDRVNTMERTSLDLDDAAEAASKTVEVATTTATLEDLYSFDSIVVDVPIEWLVDSNEAEQNIAPESLRQLELFREAWNSARRLRTIAGDYLGTLIEIELRYQGAWKSYDDSRNNLGVYVSSDFLEERLAYDQWRVQRTTTRDKQQQQQDATLSASSSNNVELNVHLSVTPEAESKLPFFLRHDYNNMDQQEQKSDADGELRRVYRLKDYYDKEFVSGWLVHELQQKQQQRPGDEQEDDDVTDDDEDTSTSLAGIVVSSSAVGATAASGLLVEFRDQEFTILEALDYETILKVMRTAAEGRRLEYVKETALERAFDDLYVEAGGFSWLTSLYDVVALDYVLHRMGEFLALKRPLEQEWITELFASTKGAYTEWFSAPLIGARMFSVEHKHNPEEEEAAAALAYAGVQNIGIRLSVPRSFGDLKRGAKQVWNQKQVKAAREAVLRGDIQVKGGSIALRKGQLQTSITLEVPEIRLVPDTVLSYLPESLLVSGNKEANKVTLKQWVQQFSRWKVRAEAQLALRANPRQPRVSVSVEIRSLAERPGAPVWILRLGLERDYSVRSQQDARKSVYTIIDDLEVSFLPGVGDKQQATPASEEQEELLKTTVFHLVLSFTLRRVMEAANYSRWLGYPLLYRTRKSNTRVIEIFRDMGFVPVQVPEDRNPEIVYLQLLNNREWEALKGIEAITSKREQQQQQASSISVSICSDNATHDVHTHQQQEHALFARLYQDFQQPGSHAQQWIGAALTSGKARKILRDGHVRGRALTPKQKRFFGWVAGGRRRGGGARSEIA